MENASAVRKLNAKAQDFLKDFVTKPLTDEKLNLSSYTFRIELMFRDADSNFFSLCAKGGPSHIVRDGSVKFLLV